MVHVWKIRALSVTCYRSRCPVSSSDEAALSIPLLLKSLLLHISSVYVVVYLSHIHVGYINRQYSCESYLLLLCNFHPMFYYEVCDYGSNDRHFGRCYIHDMADCAPQRRLLN